MIKQNANEIKQGDKIRINSPLGGDRRSLVGLEQTVEYVAWEDGTVYTGHQTGNFLPCEYEIISK